MHSLVVHFFFQKDGIINGQQIIRSLQFFPDPPEIPRLSSVPQLLRALPPKQLFLARNEETSVQSLYKEYLRPTNNRRRHYACLQCACSKLTKPAIEGHIKKVHMKLEPAKCNCGYKSHNSECFRHHQKICGQVLSCEMCDFTTICKWRLKRHQISHNPNKNIPCKNCGKLFKNNSNIIRHEKLYCRLK